MSIHIDYLLEQRQAGNNRPAPKLGQQAYQNPKSPAKKPQFSANSQMQKHKNMMLKLTKEDRAAFQVKQYFELENNNVNGRLEVLSKLSIGLEQCNCFSMNHPRAPQTMTNANISSIQLKISRKVVQSLQKFQLIFQKCRFLEALD